MFPLIFSLILAQKSMVTCGAIYEIAGVIKSKGNFWFHNSTIIFRNAEIFSKVIIAWVGYCKIIPSAETTINFNYDHNKQNFDFRFSFLILSFFRPHL